MPAISNIVLKLFSCREQLDELSTVLEAYVEEHAGSECLLLCASHMQGEISDRLSSGLLSSTDKNAAARAPVARPAGPCTLSRIIVWCASDHLTRRAWCISPVRSSWLRCQHPIPREQIPHLGIVEEDDLSGKEIKRREGGEKVGVRLWGPYIL